MNSAQIAYERWLHAELPELRAPVMVRTCAELRRDGALAAKFSGAGGEGSVIALFPTEMSARVAVERLEARGTGTALYCPVRAGTSA